MSLQLNKHHSYHQHIYEALKNRASPAAKQGGEQINSNNRLQYHLVHHYQNQLLRNAIDQRRIQFRNFVAEKVQHQIIDKERQYETAHLKLLGNLSKLENQRDQLRLQKYHSDCVQPLPIPIAQLRYENDHALEAIRRQNCYFEQAQQYPYKFHQQYGKQQLGTRQPMIEISNKINNPIFQHSTQILRQHPLYQQRQRLAKKFNEIKPSSLVSENNESTTLQIKKEGQLTNKDPSLYNDLIEKIRKIKSYRDDPRQVAANSNSVGIGSYQNRSQPQSQSLSIGSTFQQKKDILTSKIDQEYNNKLAQAIRNKWIPNEEDNKLQKTFQIKEGSNIASFTIQKQPQHKNIKDAASYDHKKSYFYGRPSSSKNSKQKKEDQFYNIDNLMSSSKKTIQNNNKPQQKSSRDFGVEQKSLAPIKIEENLYLTSRGPSLSSYQKTHLNVEDKKTTPGQQIYSVRVKSPGKQPKNLHKKNKSEKKPSMLSIEPSANCSPKLNRKQQKKWTQKPSLVNSSKRKRVNQPNPRHKRQSNTVIGNIANLEDFSPLKEPAEFMRKHYKNQSELPKGEQKMTPQFRKQNDNSRRILGDKNEQLSLFKQNWPIKLKRRLQASENIFIDSSYRNIHHQIDHLNNSYLKEQAERRQIREKVCKFVEEKGKKRSRRNRSLLF